LWGILSAGRGVVVAPVDGGRILGRIGVAVGVGEGGDEELLVGRRAFGEGDGQIAAGRQRIAAGPGLLLRHHGRAVSCRRNAIGVVEGSLIGQRGKITARRRAASSAWGTTAAAAEGRRGTAWSLSRAGVAISAGQILRRGVVGGQLTEDVFGVFACR
jgi:hypothetical protein